MTTGKWMQCSVQTFIDCAEAETKTGPFGTQLKASEYVEHGTPVINVRNIGFGTIKTDKLEYLASETVQRLSSHLLQVNDIVFGRKGAVERHVLIRPEQNNWFQGSDCLRLRFKSKRIDPRFVSYFLITDEHKQWMMNQCSHGATMASLNQEIIWRIPLLLPDINTQRKIASILSAYDDLIENNTRRIAILEAMAQAIYREWFVEFCFPGHQKVKFVNSPLGRIPEGLRVVKVEDAIFINPRTTVSRDGEKPFVSMGAVPHNTMLIDVVATEMRTGNSGSKFKNGDTLFARITPCLENGKTAFVQFLPTQNAVAFGSTEFIVLRSQTVCPEFVYLLARSDAFRDNAIKSMSGATGRQRVQEKCFDKFFFAHPDGETLAAFSAMMQPLFRQVFTLDKNNRNLRTTRDLLLPKLISGQIDVEDLDIETKESLVEAEV